MGCRLFCGGSFGGLLGGSAVLFGDLLENAGQRGNGSQHGTQNLSLQDRQRGDRSQGVDGVHIDNLAFHETALDLELTVELLGKVSDHARRGDRIGGNGKRRGAVQLLVKLIETDVVESKAEQGVLDDRVLDLVLTALGTESSILRNGDALVINDDAGSRALQLLGKVLGPKGLMPSPKAGTVTPDVAKAVQESKAGKVEYRLDKTNIIHCPIGKVSFGPEKLTENFNALMGAILKAKPAAAKGQYIKSCVAASTMGPGVKMNAAKI